MNQFMSKGYQAAVDNDVAQVMITTADVASAMGDLAVRFVGDVNIPLEDARAALLVGGLDRIISGDVPIVTDMFTGDVLLPDSNGSEIFDFGDARAQVPSVAGRYVGNKAANSISGTSPVKRVSGSNARGTEAAKKIVAGQIPRSALYPLIDVKNCRIENSGFDVSREMMPIEELKSNLEYCKGRQPVFPTISFPEITGTGAAQVLNVTLQHFNDARASQNKLALPVGAAVYYPQFIVRIAAKVNDFIPMGNLALKIKFKCIGDPNAFITEILSLQLDDVKQASSVIIVPHLQMNNRQIGQLGVFAADNDISVETVLPIGYNMKIIIPGLNHSIYDEMLRRLQN